MKPNESAIYNSEKASIESQPERYNFKDLPMQCRICRISVPCGLQCETRLDIDYVVQVKYMSREAANLTWMHLTELGYECEVIKVAV